MLDAQTNLLNLRMQNSGSGGDSDLHARLEKVSADVSDLHKSLTLFRILSTEYLRGVGAAHLSRTEDGKWFAEKSRINGQVTGADIEQDALQKICEQAATQGRHLRLRVEGKTNAQFSIAPIRTDNGQPLLILVKSRFDSDRENPAATTNQLRMIATFHDLWFSRRRTVGQTELLKATAAVVELVSQVENCRSLQQAVHVMAQETRRYLNCHSVCIGMVRGSHLQSGTASGARFEISANTEVASFDHDSELFQFHENAWQEATLKGDLSAWPPRQDDTRFALIQHRKLVERLRLEAAISVPLRNDDDHVVGVITVVGTNEQLSGDLAANFLKCAGERMANACDLLVRAQENPLRRVVKSLQEKAGRRKLAITATTLAVLGAIMLIPLPYRVRCNCETDALQRRYASAPFEGVIKQGYVRPGDEVKQGQLLAEMNGREIRQQLAGAMFEKHRAEKKRDLFLAQDDVAQSLLAGMEAQSLNVTTKILENKQANLQIVAPVAGVILSGDLEQSQDMPVQVGQTLFEIGSLDPIRIEMLIPADEISNVESGMQVSVWLSGLGSRSLRGRIEHVQPDAEIRDSENVFVAEVVVENPEHLLRPGMRGNASITCDAHSLGWNLFHKPWEYVSSRIGW